MESKFVTWDIKEDPTTRPIVKLCEHMFMLDVKEKPLKEIREFDTITLRCSQCGDISIIWEVVK